MGGITKVLTGILGILASLAVLATIAIVGYSVLGPGENGNKQETAVVAESTANPEDQELEAENVAEDTESEEAAKQDAEDQKSPTPSALPGAEVVPVSTAKKEPTQIDGHIHDYKETVEEKATCYRAGKKKYTCEDCGDIYYVDIPSTGHVAEPEWEISKKATAEEEGIRVKKCIYCDEIVAREVIAKTSANPDATPHVHSYMASVEREPSCILAGLRKYTCSCGSFYTEQISAKGHVATDWTTAEEASETKSGTEQRTCTVCGVLLDSRVLPKKSPTPSASAATNASSASDTGASPAASGSATTAPTAAPSPSAAPTPTPHEHQYTSYVLLEPNCTEEGIRSYVCSGCGSSYAEVIPVDETRHKYNATIIKPTTTSGGYTLYRCVRCNSEYMDNYTEPLRENK